MNFDLIPAGIADIGWIAALEKSVYSGIDAIPFNILNDWYLANQNVFYIIRDPLGNGVGHIDVLPLRPAVLQRFIRGEILEKDIRGADIFSLNEKEQITGLYIESLAIPYLKGYARACALRDALAGIRMIICTICTPNPLTTLYAMPASPEGLKLMKRMNFRLLVDGKTRKDGYGMYAVPFIEFYLQR